MLTAIKGLRKPKGRQFSAVYPGDMVPSRPGVYARRFAQYGWRYAHWNGRIWGYSAVNPASAKDMAEYFAESRSQSGVEWVGLAEPAP